jgi:WhiB family transcriptional regulator, redox-sensing transcriptional regulator
MREMGPTGSSADPLVFRKLLFRNDDNASRRATACPGPQVNAIRRDDLAGRDDQEEWAHMWITDWTARAACKGTDPDELFVQGAAQNRAKLICRGCTVRTECLADALDNRIEFGVWGGMTERERRALLRRRPDVTSWRELLEHARNQYERTDERSSDDELVAS